jgi:hypothetical protein
MVVESAAPAHVGQMKVWTALGGSNSGIVGNRAHSTGFHRGAGYVHASDYSRRRDPNGADGPYSGWGFACAGDYHHGGNKILRARHAALLTRLMDGDDDLANVCEFIGQPWADKPVVYWAVWNGRRTLKRYSGTGHDMWSHVSVWRSNAVTQPALWQPRESKPTPPPKTPGVVKLVPPPWPKGATYFAPRDNAPVYATVRKWEARMRQRGWTLKADGRLSLADGKILKAFQKEKGLTVDGRLGPKSFAAAWTAKVS